VLVFLTGRTYQSALRGMEEVSLLPHQFGLVDSKWTVKADGIASFGWACATSDETSCGPERNDRVDLARVAQANCRAEPKR